MNLTFVERSSAERPRNILLYGPPGTGKTVGACSTPAPVLFINAEGSGALDFAYSKYGADTIHEVAFKGRDTLNEVFLAIKDGGEHRTVAVDSLGEVYRILLEGFGGERPSLQNYGDANIIVERFVRSLRDLDIHMVLVAHEQLDDIEGEAVRRPVTGGKKLPEQIMAQMDIVAYTGVVLPEGDEGEPIYMGQLIETQGRRCKDRSGGLGTHRELNLSEWIATYNEAMAPAKPATKTTTKAKAPA